MAVFPARLKAFTLTVDGQGRDLQQARDFLHAVELNFLLEPISVTPQQVDFREAIRIIEDYKPLDVQAATMTIALLGGIRSRYPDWKYLVNGDGGDESCETTQLKKMAS